MLLRNREMLCFGGDHRIHSSIYSRLYKREGETERSRNMNEWEATGGNRKQDQNRRECRRKKQVGLVLTGHFSNA